MNPFRLRAVEEFVRHTAVAVSTATLYPLEHGQVTGHVSAARRRLEEALAGGDDLSLMRLEDTVVVDGVPLSGGLYIQRFGRMLAERGIGHLRIGSRAGSDEILALVGALAGKGSEGGVLRSTENLRLGKVSAPAGASGFERITTEAPGPLDREDLFRLAEIYDRTRRGQTLDAAGISETVSNFIHAMAGDADPLLVLAPLRDMDEYTFAHSVNVCLLNLAQARSFGIDGPLLRDIGVAALLHDIGKLFVPEEIINKPGKLDEEEWKIIRRHPALGARYLLAARGVPRLAVLNAYEHHLRFDGTGYPQVDEYWQQNICSQMTTLSDIVDSMLTRRSYREPLSLAVVAATLREYRGNHLHPVLVDNFLHLIQWTGDETPSP